MALALEPSTSYSIHFFTQSVSSFRNTCPHHRYLFCCSIKIISSIPSLPLNSLLETLSFTLTLHIHLQTKLTSLLNCSNLYYWWPFFIQIQVHSISTTVKNRRVQTIVKLSVYFVHLFSLKIKDIIFGSITGAPVAFTATLQ